MEQSCTQHADSGYISVSEDGRYFLDQNGRPFLWLGDTLWELFRCYTIEEAEAILENRRNKGYSFPDPSPASSSFIHDESWLAFNMIQTCVNYELIYRMVTEDYSLIPTKPTVMAEGGYEGFEFGRLQISLEIRKQAYWSRLAGGHHSYGHNDNWVSPSSWESWIDSPGSFQMGIYREVIS